MATDAADKRETFLQLALSDLYTRHLQLRASGFSNEEATSIMKEATNGFLRHLERIEVSKKNQSP